ncbi:MAG: NAD(P)/FAD-dependent oxidoreductase [bacterium]
MASIGNPKNDVIIIGAGIIGCSLAYHLCKLGCTDVLILEREAFAGTGSTSKANGGIRAQFSTEMNIEMSLLSMRLLDKMDAEMLSEIGYKKTGYLFVTADENRWRVLWQNVAFQKEHGVSVELLTQNQVAEKIPFAKTDDLIGGSFGARDGFIDPNGLLNAFLTRALAMGAQYQPNAKVTDLIRQNGSIVGVKTTACDFRAEKIVNCAGPWAKEIAQMAGVDLPVEPVRRQIVVTGPTDKVPRVFPMIVDTDTGLLARREGDGVGLAYSNPDEPPGQRWIFDPDFIEVIAPKMLKRFPILEDAGIDFRKSWAGCYEVTPDHHAIIGESGVQGFYLCNGFSGHGVMHAPAAGYLLAEMLVKGKSEKLDIASLSLRRFAEGKLLHEVNVL